MGGWLDRWAKRAAEAAPSAVHEPVSPPPQHSSRRDFLKKAGVVGGVAWSVPVLQTVMAPAASASVGTPINESCTDTGPCAGGAASCNGVTCGGVGAACTSLCGTGLVCSGRNGGPSTCGGPGANCATDGQCTYGNCNGGTCGSNNAPCTAGSGDTQCAQGFTCRDAGGWKCKP